jgi:CDP-diglyceride synthetase
MWEQYKKTFWGMQLVIALVSAAVYWRFYRLLMPTVVFFLVLQVAAVAGGLWASQLKKRFQPHV